MSIEVAQMDAVQRLDVAIKRIRILQGALALIGMQQKVDEIKPVQSQDVLVTHGGAIIRVHDLMIEQARSALAETKE